MTVTDGDILKAVVTIDLPLDVKAQNVFYYKAEFGVDYSNSQVLSAIVTAVEDFYDQVEGSIVTAVALSDVIVSKWVWDAVDGWITGAAVGQSALTDIFASAGEMLPHAVAAIISGATADPKVNSRKSIAGFDEAAQEDSEVSAGSLVELALAATSWITNQIISGSDQLAPGVPGAGGVWQDLLSASVSSILGSQRRRKPGVGI